MFGGKKRNERSGKTGSCHMQMQQCGLSDHQAYPYLRNKLDLEENLY